MTSASLLANGAASDDALARLRQCPDLSVGLHVNLTQGRPVRAAAKSSLVDRRGYFYARGVLAIRLSVGAVAMDDVEAEIAAQAQWAARADSPSLTKHQQAYSENRDPNNGDRHRDKPRSAVGVGDVSKDDDVTAAASKNHRTHDDQSFGKAFHSPDQGVLS